MTRLGPLSEGEAAPGVSAPPQLNPRVQRIAAKPLKQARYADALTLALHAKGEGDCAHSSGEFSLGIDPAQGAGGVYTAYSFHVGRDAKRDLMLILRGDHRIPSLGHKAAKTFANHDL